MNKRQQAKLEAAQHLEQQKRSELVNCERAVAGLGDQLFLAMKSRERVQQELQEASAAVREAFGLN